MINTRINGRFDIVLPEHRSNRLEWYTEKGWEKERLNSMFENLNKDDVMFYVGAEEGDMAALCAMWCKEVVLFEPNDKVWPNIKAIWEANKLKTPYCFSGFASSETGTYGNLRWGFPESADGEVIGDHGFKELIDPGDIPQIKIDDITDIFPTAITLDVEGSEWEVLKGAQETIKKYKPKIWLSLHPEFMFRLYGKYGYDLRKWIKDFGYKEKLLAYEHEVHLYYYL